MNDWQTYLDIIRQEEEAASSTYRLLATTTTTTTSDDPIDSKAALDPLAEEAGQAPLPAETAETAERLPERAGELRKDFRKASESLRPAADVASRRREASGTGTSRREASGTGGTGVPRWQEIDPRAYQPRPFGPMETDADWPGEDEEGEAAAPQPAIDAGGEASKKGTGAPHLLANKFAPNGLRPPSPPCFA